MKVKRTLGLGLIAVLAVGGGIATFSIIRENRQWDLSGAAWSGDLITVKRCVERGASIDATPLSEAGGGEPALVAAVWGGHDEVISFLLDHGANINRRDSCGNTALLAAAMRGHLSTAQILLSRGANPNIGGEGFPLGNARERNDKKMTELLMLYGATELSPSSK